MTPLSTLELAGAAVLTGSGALNALLGLAAGRHRSAVWFTAFFLCLTVTNLASLSIIGWGEWLSPEGVRWIRSLSVSACYLLGPLFYAYVRASLPMAEPWPPQAWRRHAMPFFGIFSLGLLDVAWPEFALWPAADAITTVAYHAWIGQGLPYFAAAAWQVHASRSALRALPAGESHRRLLWLRWLTTVAAALWLLAGLKRLAVASFGMEDVPANAGLLMTASAALFFLTWFGVRQRMLGSAAENTIVATGSAAAQARYARTGLDQAGCERVAGDLLRLMRDQPLYVDAGLDLAMLSRHSGWPPAYISQALNQHLRQNFFEFVSGFRMAAACLCLADPAERRTILDIALACGFGSKSTFNAVFRRDTGLTPSEFRRRHAKKPGPPANTDV